MDISGVGGGAAQAALQYSVPVKMMKASMDITESIMDMLLQGLEAAVTGVGGNIDTTA